MVNKNKIIFLIIILTSFLPIAKTYPHIEFFHNPIGGNNVLTQFNYDPDDADYDMDNIMTWTKSQAASIPYFFDSNTWFLMQTTIAFEACTTQVSEAGTV